MSGSDPSIVIFGAGAIGCSVGGWIAPHVSGLRFLARGAAAEALRLDGLAIYRQGDERSREIFPAAVIEDPEELATADVVLLAVKTYQIDAAAEAIRPYLREDAIVVGLQNGIENQALLPRHFNRVIYGIAWYNAWIDAPGVVGYQRRGPLLLGTPDNSLREETRALAAVLNRGVETLASDRFQDAAHAKVVINLANSFTTLVGHQFREISSVALVQRILSNLLYEGMQVLKAAGFKEHPVPGIPGWQVVTALTKLPQFLTRPIFQKNLRKMVVSSMAQDVIVRGAEATELDTINGRVLALAHAYGVRVPYNETVYALCKERFAAVPFEPMDVRDVWAAIERRK